MGEATQQSVPFLWLHCRLHRYRFSCILHADPRARDTCGSDGFRYLLLRGQVPLPNRFVSLARRVPPPAPRAHQARVQTHTPDTSVACAAASPLGLAATTSSRHDSKLAEPFFPRHACPPLHRHAGVVACREPGARVDTAGEARIVTGGSRDAARRVASRSTPGPVDSWSVHLARDCRHVPTTQISECESELAQLAQRPCMPAVTEAFLIQHAAAACRELEHHGRGTVADAPRPVASFSRPPPPP
jgi:hypothetical protein